MTEAELGFLNIGDLILYKNNQLIAFNKPSSLPVQADLTEDKSLLDLAEIYAKSSLYLTHRIDRPVSGVVLLAKNKKALTAINRQFQDRTIEKTYLAIVKHMPEQAEGTLVHYFRKNGKKNRSHAFTTEEKGTKKGTLDYKVVGSSDNYHLLEIKLHSGRHHQIRAQFAAIKNPIKGDVKYGFRRNNPDRSIDLHAWKLSFKHPVSEEQVVLTAPLPDSPIWNSFGIEG